MNGIEFLADTNAIIYLLSGKECMRPYLHTHLSVSVISRMEVLSFSGITAEEETVIRNLLNECNMLQIDSSVVEETIRLRRQYKIKLPDAIIAATAIANNIPLITADHGFSKIAGLDIEQLTP